MTTTIDPCETEYLYVKDLPDAGGLRARRMSDLRHVVEKSKANRWERLFVWWESGALSFAGVMMHPSMTRPPDTIEVYDLTRDLAPQFAERRAIRW